jgi:Beta-galactosidase/beta-glucuronidase
MKYLKVMFAAVLFFSASSSYAGTREENLKAALDAAEKYNNSMKYKAPEYFKIYDKGSEEWIDYTKYGTFQNLGTEKYKYSVTDSQGLKSASGEGIYPNAESVYKSPAYKKLVKKNKLKGTHWDFVNTDDFQTNFYKWATTQEDPGVKLYFTAIALDRAGNYRHAIKAYYACMVFFPKAVGYTQWKTPWYIGPVCISRINYLTKKYPELGVKLEGAEIRIDNTFDNDVKNDIFYVNPGKLVPATAKDFERKHIDLSKAVIKKSLGKGNVKLVEYDNGDFQLMVDGKPYFVKGITYGPNKVGVYPDGDLNNIKDWAFMDEDGNGSLDGPYDTWVDADRNNKQDENEKPVGDFALMKAMGVNTLRLYHSNVLNKELLKEGYEKYGFMYMVGNLIGMYAVDAGTTWEKGTDYNDPEQKKNMLASLKKTVEMYKDEPYVLMWVLGNENNYSSFGATNVQSNPEAYYKFANECAKLVKSLDPQKRPVAISNGDLLFLDYCIKYTPDIDIYGTNSYRGEQGLGSLWQDVKLHFGKPVVITEYGCPAFAKGWSAARAEEGQASYHKGTWNNIADNFAGVEGGTGNSLGGVVFVWSDEWWKTEGDSDPFVHDEVPKMMGAFLDGGGYEEWFGLCGLGDGTDSQFKRQLRKSYFMYKELWNK